MELIILLTLSIMTFLLSLIAVGFSIYNYIQFKVFTSSTALVNSSTLENELLALMYNRKSNHSQRFGM